MKGSWCAIFFSAVALAFLAATTQAAPSPDKTKAKDTLSLPPVFDKKAPENAKDLEELQEHVKKVLKKVLPAVVSIQVGNAAGSGVIIDAEGHVLTAGHVSGKPGRNCLVILPDGKQLKAKTLGQNTGIDSGMVKITAKGNFPHLQMGDSEKVKPSQWVLSIGHPGGFKRGRTPVVRLGRVVSASKNFIQTDCTLVGGDSGGPLFDMRGKVIGIHSRIGLSIKENVHVPIDTFKVTWDRLAESDSWSDGFLGRLFGGRRSSGTPYLGVRFKRGGDDLRIDEVHKDTPASRAGLKAGDIIQSMNGTEVKDRESLVELIGKKKVGDEITLLVERDGKEIKLKLKLGRRPAE